MNRESLIQEMLPLNSAVQIVYSAAQSNGWYLGERQDQVFIPSAVANFHSEVSELWESYRKSSLKNPCDKSELMKSIGVEPLTCEEEEIADLAMRVFGYCAHRQIDLARAVTTKIITNAARPYRNGGKVV